MTELPQEQVQHSLRTLLDGSIAIGALASPVWIDWIEHGAGAIMAVLGVVLVGIRVYMAIKELKRKAK
tara:strand:- start:228 stop:431 length:204 start_codon:yes stop_codon:yes gene_type:complete